MTITQLQEDTTTPATMFEAELTYFADGTPVIMRWNGGEKRGTTFGMKYGSPYAYQMVRFADGSESAVAPHVLHRVDLAAEAVVADRIETRARSLGWSAAQADVIEWAAAGQVYADERGYFKTDRRGGRGRAIARARMVSLLAAGLLDEEYGCLSLTDDGAAALAAWRSAEIAPAEVELDELPPLVGGAEARRRRTAYDAMIERQVVETAEQLQQALARVAEQAADADAEALVDAERRMRTGGAWDAIYAAEQRHNYSDADRGDVVTFYGTDPEADAEQAETVVIVPCGGSKADTDVPVPAGELYTGSYHRAARRAAEALGGRVVILSALHGLVELSHLLMPYELRAGDPGTVTGQTLREQAAALGLTGAAAIVLGGRAYVDLALQVWPNAQTPLQGSRGIGEQLGRLAAIYKAPQVDKFAQAAAHAAARQAADAEREVRRRALFASAGAIEVGADGRAVVALTFPAASGKGQARVAAAARFAGAYGVTTLQGGTFELLAHGAAEQVARFASALPRLLHFVDEYASLSLRQLARWERHSSVAPTLAGVEAAELRARRRRFRAEAAAEVVEVLLDEARALVEVDEAAPMWGQAAAVAGVIADYGRLDVAEMADAAEVAELLGAARVDVAEIVEGVEGVAAELVEAPAECLVAAALPRRARRSVAEARRGARGPVTPRSASRAAGRRLAAVRGTQWGTAGQGTQWGRVAI